MYQQQKSNPFTLFCLWNGLIPYKGGAFAAAEVKTGYYKLFEAEEGSCPACVNDRPCKTCGAYNGVRFKEVE